MLDTIIRGCTIVDGTGAPSYTGDIGIAGGRIAALGKVTDAAHEVIDADGALATPGFIDPHTHYDGQFLWDDAIDPSFSHGVTTVIAGNCGVGFAPVRHEYRKQLIEMMEGVEDIPGIVLDKGLDWKWTSFPDYLDRIAARRYTMDVGAAITHAPLRVFIMGERALTHEVATDEDIAGMARLVREAMAAGAAGFSAGRILEHHSSTGAAIPGTFTETRELIEIGKAMGARGRGVFQMVPLGASGGNFGNGISREQREAEHELMAEISRTSGRPLTYVLLQDDVETDAWMEMVAASERAVATGADLRPQISSRQIGLQITLDGYHIFRCRPSYLAIAQLPTAARAGAMRDPERRRAILSETDVPVEQAPTRDTHHFAQMFRQRLANFYAMSLPIDFEPEESSRLGAIAAATGRTMEEVFYDLLTEDDGTGVASLFVHNYAEGDLESTRRLLDNPRVVSGLGDGGAHLTLSCDGSMPSFKLAFWARDRRRGPRLPIELMVRRLTGDAASLYELDDRGTIAPGKRADLNLIDFDALAIDKPRMAFDLPEGGGRLLQKARGYLATFVEGTMTRRFDEDTGARPGRLLRIGR